MEYYVKSVVPIIESNYDKFTTVERNIADFLYRTERSGFFTDCIPHLCRTTKTGPKYRYSPIYFLRTEE